MRVLPVLAALLIGAGACSSGTFADPVLDVVSFELGENKGQPCRIGFECFVLVAMADGTRNGTGSCQVWATTQDGERIGDEPRWTSGDFGIEPGETYEWELQVVVPSGSLSGGDWDAICRPAPEG